MDAFLRRVVLMRQMQFVQLAQGLREGALAHDAEQDLLPRRMPMRV